MTRTSTYSKASNREENIFSAFLDESKAAFLNPVDEQAEDHFNQLNI
jgi:hypothetical protein